MKFDLHVHTYFSDGKYSPEDVVDLAVERGMKGIAITDHDTILGIQRAIDYSERFKDFKIIPGIEFGCIYDNEEVHILGYFIDYQNLELLKVTKFLKESREKRGIEIINKLKDLGCHIDYHDVEGVSKEGFIGRVPIAKALIDEGYVSSIKEAFDTYLDRGKLAYVEKSSLNIKETINIIKNAGGVASLAHPGMLKNKHIIHYCIQQGIDGIECIHSKHTQEQVDTFKNIVKNNGLFITGGSDCHGEIIGGELLLGKFYANLNIIPELKEEI